MAWVAHNATVQAEDGYMRSKTVPALAAHRGHLWCLWADFDGKLWFAVSTAEGDFGDRQLFPDAGGLPVIANLNGHLHTIVVRESGELMHYIFDDDDSKNWEFQGSLGPSIVALHTPCLVAFHNKLFLVYLRDKRLYCTIWAASPSTPHSKPDGSWTEPKLIADAAFQGIPALFVVDGVLHLLCAEDTEERTIQGYSYDYITATWNFTTDVSEGRAAAGVSATSYGNSAYLGFIEAGPEDESHSVTIAAYTHGSWQPHESVDGKSAADPPQIAILNGRIHCVFNDNTKSRDLRWYSRPVLGYSLSSWMGRIPDDTLISDVTLPGTHDSCARSNVPFVRTQYLSISQQLALGIRFIDLRLRRHDDGKLYCYHGGYPLALPYFLSFESVMDEVWTFFLGGKRHGGDRLPRPPTETVLVSINNDDRSDKEQHDPAPFYAAVAAAIAAAPPYPDGSPRWFTGGPGGAAAAATPTLGAVRGRAVLLRRYAGDPAVAPQLRMGLDLSAWIDDSPDFTIVTPVGVRVRLQDKWKYSERIELAELVTSKSGYVRRLMEHASSSSSSSAAPRDAESDGDIVVEPDPQRRDLPERPEDADNNDGGGGENGPTASQGPSRPEDWFINFCSAVGDPVEHGEVAEAKWIAVGAHSDLIGKWVNGINVLTRDYLQRQEGTGRRRLGIVNLDYPELPEDNDLVARLIETNFLAS